jgi:hypothetical protein
MRGLFGEVEEMSNDKKTQRVKFSFDDRSLESVKRLEEQQRGQSFEEIAVTNPETGESRVIVIPVIENQQRNSQSIIDSLDYAASFVPDEHKPSLHLASDELVRLAGEVARLKEREAHFASVLGVADGGRYRADWDGRLEAVIAERDRLITRLEVAEKERDSLQSTLAEQDELFNATAVLENEAALLDRAERAEAKYRTAMLALESLTPGGSEFVGDVERCVAHVRARQTALLDNIKRQVRLRVGLAKERDKAIAAATRLEADALTLRQQAAAILDEGPLFRAVSEILDGCAHHPNVEPDYTVIHQTWERFTAWVRSTALLVGPANVAGE